jgi:hypothetical protein
MFNPIQIADNYYVVYESPDPYRTKGRYRPSDSSSVLVDDNGDKYVVGSCTRQLWYRYTNAPVTDPLSASILRKMELGNMIEGAERYILGKAGVVRDHNVPVEVPHPMIPDAVISGEMDIIFDTDPPVIGEVKSGYGSKFYNYVLGASGRPNESHVLQGMLYLWMYGTAQELVFIYIDRGSSVRREHRMVLSGNHPVINNKLWSHINITNVLERYVRLHNYIGKGVCPPPDYEQVYNQSTVESHRASGRITASARSAWYRGEAVGDWQCRDCPFRSRCSDDARSVASDK